MPQFRPPPAPPPFLCENANRLHGELKSFEQVLNTDGGVMSHKSASRHVCGNPRDLVGLRLRCERDRFASAARGLRPRHPRQATPAERLDRIRPRRPRKGQCRLGRCHDSRRLVLGNTSRGLTPGVYRVSINSTGESASVSLTEAPGAPKRPVPKIGFPIDITPSRL